MLIRSSTFAHLMFIVHLVKQLFDCRFLNKTRMEDDEKYIGKVQNWLTYANFMLVNYRTANIINRERGKACFNRFFENVFHKWCMVVREIQASGHRGRSEFKGACSYSRFRCETRGGLSVFFEFGNPCFCIFL